MPSTYTYPGVYVEEIPSGVRTIGGVSTSDTAFVDFFRRGPMDVAVRVTGFEDFGRQFGGLDARSPASYAIQQYFLNGGQIAWVTRVASGSPAPATLPLQGGSPSQDSLVVEAGNEGVWGRSLQAAVDWNAREADQFNLSVREIHTVRGRQVVARSEVHRNLNMATGSARYAVDVVNNGSEMVHLEDAGLGERPGATGTDVTGPDALADVDNAAFTNLTGGDDGGLPGATELISGLNSLDAIAPHIFNILCIPAAATLDGTEPVNTPNLRTVITEASVFCERKRAFFIADIPEGVNTGARMLAWMNANDGARHRNAAVYFPRVEVADAEAEGRPRNIGSSGTMAGVFARTDATRGVWKSPAGTDGDLRGVGLPAGARLSDLDNGGLNPFGINALRTFPIFGNVAWGARTLDGAEIAASEWKYIAVRRTALYIEESLFQGLKWVVFEPNDEKLWAQIRVNVTAFMHGLFRQGAFQGTTPKVAYRVQCDAETTTQNDIDHGVVNILVGFAPLKPAEFVVIRLQQLAGQSQS